MSTWFPRKICITILSVSICVGFLFGVEWVLLDVNLEMFVTRQNMENMLKSRELISNITNYDEYLRKYDKEFSGINTGWYRYRLGDMFRSKKHARLDGVYHITNFPNSIATQYLLASNATDFGNYSILLNIVQNRSLSMDFMKDYNISFNDTIIVHLRTGDVIDHRTDLNVNEILMDNTNKYYRPMIYYINIFEKLKKYHLDKVLFITGYHYGHNHTKSKIYTMKIIKLFELNGYKDIKLRVNQNPDQDFLIMCNSKYFVKSGGGFSKMIADIVQMKGGKVFPCLNFYTFCFKKFAKDCIYCTN